MTPTEMAKAAYYQLIREISEAQARIIRNEALIARFGTAAIIPDPMFHTLATKERSLDLLTKQIQRAFESIERKLAAVHDLEEMFKLADDARTEAMVKQIAEDHFGAALENSDVPQ